MAQRGPHAKGTATRAEILEVALDVIARDRYSSATDIRALGIEAREPASRPGSGS